MDGSTQHLVAAQLAAAIVARQERMPAAGDLAAKSAVEIYREVLKHLRDPAPN